MGLFTPAWKSKDEKKALAFIEKCDRQGVLEEIALSCEYPSRRIAAVNRLSDQQALFRVAVEKQTPCEEAAARLTDPRLLSTVARKAASAKARLIAVRKLADQAVLDEAVRLDADAEVREAAWRRLEDKASRVSLGLADKSPSLRELAVAELDDPTRLAEVAKNDMSEWVRKAAVEKLTDPAVLEWIAQHDVSDYASVAAVERLADQAALGRVAKNGHLRAREAALKRITDPAIRTDVMLSSWKAEERIRAIRSLSPFDPRLLQAAQDKHSEEVREVAVYQMQDVDMLVELVKVASDPNPAYKKLRDMGKLDEALLQKIMETESADVRSRAELELDKLAFYARLQEREAGRIILSEYERQDLKALSKNPSRESVEAILLLLREFGGRHSPTPMAYSIRSALQKLYRSQPALRSAIRAANNYSIQGHNDIGHGSCHSDDGPMIFDFH